MARPGAPPRGSAVEAALRLDFLDGAGNIVLVAPQGLGKTLIAKNIAHHAVLAGHSVRFVTAAQMLVDLGAQDSPLCVRRFVLRCALDRAFSPSSSSTTSTA